MCDSQHECAFVHTSDAILAALSGDYSSCQVEQLHRFHDLIVDAANRSSAPAVIVDLQDVPVVGAHFLGILASVSSVLRAQGKTAILCSPNSNVLAAIRAVRLDVIWEVHDTRRQAHCTVRKRLINYG